MSKKVEDIPYNIRCPENVITPRKPPVHHQNDTAGWTFPQTENQENFRSPKHRKRIVTREGQYEQFLWHEFYNQYVAAMKKLNEVKKESFPTSEYLDKFGQIAIPEQSEESMQEIIEKYPIYASGVISFYNPNGRKHAVFNRTQTVSRPTTEQYDTQFG